MKLLHLKVVLVAVDSDESALDTLRSASEFARTAGASLHVVHVTTLGRPVRAQPSRESTECDPWSLFESAGLPANEIRLHLIAGEPVHVIRSLADKIRADVIVLGRHRGRPALGKEMGSTALGVVNNSWAPCLILAGAMRLPLERVLVPVDLSRTSRGALVVGLSWASALRGTRALAGSASDDTVSLRALLVERLDSSAADFNERALDEELDRLRRDAGSWANVTIDCAVVANSDVPRAIADYATDEHADLIVFGTRGLGQDAIGRLGSVSLGVARRVATPLLLVPPAVWNAYASTS